MAGDWIKMRIGLMNHPKVFRMASALCADRFRVVGGLHAVWSVFDQFSIDGILNGYSLSSMDEAIGWQGFSAAMEASKWLQIYGEELVCPEFSTHNGASAKRRAMEADRKRLSRDVSALNADERPQSVRKMSSLEERRGELDQELPPQRAVEVGKTQPTNGHDLLGDLPAPKVKRNPAVPYEEIRALFHEILCPPLPTVMKLTNARKDHIRARWSDELPTLQDWRDMCEAVKTSNFLMGRAVPTQGRRPFIASFDFLINPQNLAKLAEGWYHRD